MKINNETKVGLLAAISVTLLILGYNFLKAKKIFQNTFILYANYETVASLSVGNPIVYNGLRVGQVNSLKIDPEKGDITVGLNVEQSVKIPVDSRAIIYASDLLGSKAIRIERGKSVQYCNSGHYLKGTVEDPLSKRVNDEVLPIKDKIEDLIKQTDMFVGWLNTTMDESNGNKIDNILLNFDKTTKNFERASYKIDTLLGSFKTTVNQTNSMLENLNNQNDNINKIVGNVKVFSDSLLVSADDVRNMMNQAASTISDIEKLVENIEGGEGTLGKLVNDETLYDNLNVTLHKLDTLVSGFDEDPRIDIYHRIGNRKNTKPEHKKIEERKMLRLEKRKARKDTTSLKNGQ